MLFCLFAIDLSALHSRNVALFALPPVVLYAQHTPYRHVCTFSPYVSSCDQMNIAGGVFWIGRLSF
jgi:hypothetical protein